MQESNVELIVAIAASIAMYAVGIAWFFILPVIGLLWCVGWIRLGEHDVPDTTCYVRAERRQLPLDSREAWRMKRINPADAVELFRRVDMKPQTGESNTPGCGCLLQAMLKDSGSGFSSIYRFATAQFGTSYKWGLIDAFDGCDSDFNAGGRGVTDESRYYQGYEDGRAAREALIAAGMMEPANA